jgi:hypothetical protein
MAKRNVQKDKQRSTKHTPHLKYWSNDNSTIPDTHIKPGVIPGIWKVLSSPQVCMTPINSKMYETGFLHGYMDAICAGLLSFVYICIDIASFCDSDILFWNCSDSVVLFVRFILSDD